MEKFGYTLNPSSRIDLDNADKETFASLVQMEPDARKCMACGSCTASCTATSASDSLRNTATTSVRSAILALQNGKPEHALECLKRCLLCGKCTMVCPRGINTRHLILAINAIYQNN